MTKLYSLDFRTRVAAFAIAHRSTQLAATTFSVSKANALRWAKQLRNTGSVAIGKVGSHKKPILPDQVVYTGADWWCTRSKANQSQVSIPCFQGNKQGNWKSLIADLGIVDKKPQNISFLMKVSLSIVTGNYICGAEKLYCQTGKQWVFLLCAGYQSFAIWVAIMARPLSSSVLLIFQNVLEDPAPLTLLKWLNSDLRPVNQD